MSHGIIYRLMLAQNCTHICRKKNFIYKTTLYTTVLAHYSVV